jgi:hypothetical protein
VHRPLTSIAGLGVVGALFLAMMSMVYLGRIPGKEDVRLLEEDLRTLHGVYLSAVTPLKIQLVRSARKGEPKGLVIDCSVRADLARDDAVVAFHLDRIAQSALENRNWRGYLDYVTVNHAGPRAVTRTRHASDGASAAR